LTTAVCYDKIIKNKRNKEKRYEKNKKNQDDRDTQSHRKHQKRRLRRMPDFLPVSLQDFVRRCQSEVRKQIIQPQITPVCRRKPAGGIFNITG
jgi:hypothetical protein